MLRELGEIRFFKQDAKPRVTVIINSHGQLICSIIVYTLSELLKTAFLLPLLVKLIMAVDKFKVKVFQKIVSLALL